MAFRTLVQITPAGAPPAPAKAKAKKAVERGCEHCPLDKVAGVQKIMGEIHGRRILLFAQSPGPEENREGVELIGPAGRWFWSEMKRAGLKREDVDIQNAVRCFPASPVSSSYRSYLKMRNPSAQEIRCCTVHNEAALAKSQAKLILILGKVAALSVLQTRSLPEAKVFWSDKLKAKVFLVDHPSFFLRGYGAGQRLHVFRATLGTLARDWRRKSDVESLSDDYGYLRQQDYRLVTGQNGAAEAEATIRRYAERGRRVSVDIEGTDEAVTHCGFCPKPGLSFTFDMARSKVRAVAQRVLEDRDIRKVMHYGCSDVKALRDKSSIRVRGYDHDTNYSEYLRFSDLKSYGLGAVAERRFPDFSGYKTIIARDMIAQVENVPRHIVEASPGVQYKYLTKHGLWDITKLKPDTIRLYNGADADITKRVEIENKKHVPQALMDLYIDLSFVLSDMEPNGPQFDFEQHDMLAVIYPLKEKILRGRLVKLAGRKDFNPGATKQVEWLLYDHLGLKFPYPGTKPNTQKMTLLLIGQKHEAPNLVLEWRAVSKVRSTYLLAYEKCAKLWGRLRTRWWSSGARTGRLSSGGARGAEKGRYINLQNIKKDPQIKNMCVADPEWRTAFGLIDEVVRRLGKPMRRYWRLCDRETAKARQEHRRAEYPPEPADSIAARAAILKKLVRLLQTTLANLRTFLVYDFGQLEVRVMAQMSGDKNLIRDCMRSDIHSQVGSVMTGWDVERIKNDDATRTLTKNVHFGIMFGISKLNLFAFVVAMSPADMRGRITEEQISEAYDRYFERYNGVARYIEKQRAYAREHKCVHTLFGMVQTLDVRDDDVEDVTDLVDVDSGGGKRGSYWGNQAVNGPIQGTAHQLMICALVNIRRKAKKYLAILGIPTMEVHDALYFNVRVNDLTEAFSLGKYLLEKESLRTVEKDFPDIDWKVPVVVEAKAGIRLGTDVKVTGKTTPAEYLLDWYRVCDKQMKALNQELADLVADRLSAV